MLGSRTSGILKELIFMALEPSDVLFIAIVIWLILEILDGGGGGHRARVPVRS